MPTITSLPPSTNSSSLEVGTRDEPSRMLRSAPRWTWLLAGLPTRSACAMRPDGAGHGGHVAALEETTHAALEVVLVEKLAESRGMVS